jgi:NADH:ubiquinone oxidoreductase subunit 6 (subunit J)
MDAGELILNGVFYVLAIAAIAGAIAVATSRNIVRSAFALLAVLFSVAALYAVMKADFIAAAQVLIYVGGILVLIIFAVMLTHRITDVKLSNDSTPGPAAFCAAKWRTDSEVVRLGGDGFEVELRQYQADGATGLAFGGSAFEESVVLSATVISAPDASKTVDQVVIAAVPGNGKEASKYFPYKGRDSVYRETFDKLAEGDWHWSVRLLGREKDAKGGEVDKEWTFPSGKADFSIYRGVTQPIALALAGPYLFAFEVVSVLLLAALVGAAFLARKEVKEA